MKGRILHIDQQTGDGVITGADGRRYHFGAGDLKGSGELAFDGVAVDFEVRDDRAVEIYRDSTARRGLPHQIGSKNRIIAAALAFFLGYLGFHKFYLGRHGAGMVMLACGLLGWILFFIPTAIIGAVAFVEAIIYIAISDEAFFERYELGERSWF